MGLILLIVVGGIVGWLASIMTRTDDRHGILLNVAVGVAGALVSALLIEGSSILGGISPIALFVSFAGSVVLLALFGLYRRRMVR